jgi:hypothetical protein
MQATATGFLLQVGREQLSRFSAELDKRMREVGKQTLSKVETESLAAQVWEKYKKKDGAQQIAEFLHFKGGRVPMPIGFPGSTWNNMSNEAKASAVSGIEQGMTLKNVIIMVGK